MEIFLTGSTGLLGGEILINLSKRSGIKKIYCLIRSLNLEEAHLKLKKVFDLHNDQYDNEKIKIILGDLSDENLTNSLNKNNDLENISLIIHSAANTSFGQIYDNAVEKINIQGLSKIVQWSKTLNRLDTFLYIGTATICGTDFKNRIVLESESPNINAHHLVKYTYTKMQGELLLEKELPANKILIARPSIIMGDSRKVKPRSPVILWAAATINALRLCPFDALSNLDIVSVDFTANAIVSLIFSKRNYRVYHISSGKDSLTTPFQLSQSFEVFFNNYPPFKFVPNRLLNKFKLWSKGKIGVENELESYASYLQHWEKTFSDKSKLRIIFSGLDPYIEFIELGHIFDNSRLLRDTHIAPPKPAHEYINNSMEYIKNINIFEGAFDS